MAEGDVIKIDADDHQVIGPKMTVSAIEPEDPTEGDGWVRILTVAGDTAYALFVWHGAWIQPTMAFIDGLDNVRGLIWFGSAGEFEMRGYDSTGENRNSILFADDRLELIHDDATGSQVAAVTMGDAGTVEISGVPIAYTLAAIDPASALALWNNGGIVAVSGTSLPTADPVAAGQLWNNNGVVMVSAG